MAGGQQDEMVRDSEGSKDEEEIVTVRQVEKTMDMCES